MILTMTSVLEQWLQQAGFGFDCGSGRDVVRAVCNLLRLRSALIHLNVVEFRQWIIAHTSIWFTEPVSADFFECVDSSSSRSPQRHQYKRLEPRTGPKTGGNDCSINHAGSDNWTHANKCIGAHSHLQPHNQRNLNTNTSKVAIMFGNWALPTWQTAC